MSENLWLVDRELSESEAWSLSGEQVAIRKAKKTVSQMQDGINQILWRKGWRIKHITEMPKGSFREYYEFFWVNPEEPTSDR